MRVQKVLSLCLAGLCLTGTIVITARYLDAQTNASASALEPEFDEIVKPFFQKNCNSCHNSEQSIAGVRVDQLDAKMDDRQIHLWEAIRHRVRGGTMPPKGLPQPSPAERDRMVAWVTKALEVARMRPAPKNGMVRRLTVSQYKNTLRELFLLDDDIAATLPPDAVSKDGFLNNKDTLQLSPLLTESYFEIAETALNRAIVNPKQKPSIQNFRVDLGTGINKNPLPEKLVLGADSMLLDTPDFTVTQLTAKKPFPFEPFFMRTKYRFIEGYRGNDTVRGWREYDSIYHSVFADLRGSRGYPKGDPYSVVDQGLLLRPAIPNEEQFDADGTYGPKANFKISLRELPDEGKFRVTVKAARYNDGLLLDPGAATAVQDPAAVISKGKGTVTIPKAGVYQADVHWVEQAIAKPDSSKLTVGLTGRWPTAANEKAKLVESPVGSNAISFPANSEPFTVARETIPTNDAMNVGEGDFSISAWIHPAETRRSVIASLGAIDRSLGWYLEIGDNRGSLRLQTFGFEEKANATVVSPPGTLQPKAWQHVTAVVRRGFNETRLYVNGRLVAKALTGAARFDNERADFQIGRGFQGELADVRLYNRPLEESEIQALVEPGRKVLKDGRVRKPHVTLTLGGRQFSGLLEQPAFLAVRLDAGPLELDFNSTGPRELDRIVLTPLPAAGNNNVAKQFMAFEKRLPRVGVHLGLRRDCGSTLAPVGAPQTVSGEKLGQYIFEGAIANFPSPTVEKDNVNYLAGVREIGVRSEYTDGRDMPRLLIRSVEFEGPYYDSWPPPSHRTIFVDFDRKDDQPAYAAKIISNFAGRAYRRPATPEEEASLLSVFKRSFASGRTFEDSIKDTLLVVLTSPQFLMIVERSQTPTPEPIDNYELSSKLSYFLWDGPPDQKLTQLAAAGTLRQQLDAEVTRMIGDARFHRFIQEFTSQWLSLDKFQVLEPDRKRYPKLTRDARTQLKQEPVEFLQYLVRNNLPFRNVVQSDFIVANETVANYYDLAEKPDSGFRFVAIPHRRPDLGGVLTQPAIMAGLSDGRESNPVKRGAWLARKIIAEPPADPPPNVPVLKEDTSGLTLRQRLEQHRNQPGCQQCHMKIDPWGVALEEYDAGGRIKKERADAKSTLPDKTEVNGMNDLKKYLAEDRIDQVAFSFLKHLSTYANGRTLTYSELAFLKQDSQKLKVTGYRTQDLFRYVVRSKSFLEK
jgi:hypothetical protein